MLLHMGICRYLNKLSENHQINAFVSLLKLYVHFAFLKKGNFLMGVNILTEMQITSSIHHFFFICESDQVPLRIVILREINVKKNFIHK